MPGIDISVLCHRLSIDRNIKPVQQKKRNHGIERQKVIRDEVRKLLQAGFIRGVPHTMWLANVVLAKKSNGGWRMCVDYTDLNKAYPKDSYPLPNIDHLVDNASSFGMLSFGDAFSGYNQVKMHRTMRKKLLLSLAKGYITIE